MKKDNLANSLNSKIEMCSEFINELNYEKHFFKPALEGRTDAGNKLQLGFSCYGLKFFHLSGQWEKLADVEKINWTNTINGYQTQDSKFPQNSYVDKNYIYNLNAKQNIGDNTPLNNIAKYIKVTDNYKKIITTNIYFLLILSYEYADLSNLV